MPSRDEYLRHLHDKPGEEPEAPEVPWHYRKTVLAAAERRLREKNVTLGASVAAAKNSGQVRVMLLTPGSDFSKNGYANTADCQGAFESNIDPEQLGRELVDSLLENIEKERVK
jgi:hypothetical protein